MLLKEGITENLNVIKLRQTATSSLSKLTSIFYYLSLSLSQGPSVIF
jgi:hypothetical protein